MKFSNTVQLSPKYTEAFSEGNDAKRDHHRNYFYAKNVSTSTSLRPPSITDDTVTFAVEVKRML